MDLIDILLSRKFNSGGGSGGGGGTQTITDYIASIGEVDTVSLGTTWSGSDPYTSTVTLTNYAVTDKTLVNILPDPNVVQAMMADGITEIFITNNNGVLTATALGGVPSSAMTLNVLCTESDFVANLEDYHQLTNKPQINDVELDGNKTAHDLGLAAQSDIPTVPVQSVNGKTGAVNLASGDIAYDETATYQAGSVGAELQEQTRHLSDKQDAPATAGTAGQVLSLDNQLKPVWATPSGGGGDVDELKINAKKTDFLINHVPLDYSKFELGNISITNSGWTYSASSKRVRTKENSSLHLKKGIQLGFEDYTNCRYYVGWYANETYYTDGWLRSDFVTPVEGDYVILLANVTEVTLTSKNDLLDTFIMTKANYAGVGMNSPLLAATGVKFIAHRGAMTDAPENTIPAFTIAGQHHVWGIETDVWETSDGYFVCLHNETVDAMTDGTGKVREKTLAQVRALTIDAGANIEDYPNLQIPTLEEYLTICKRYGVVATVEIKGISNYAGFVETIMQAGLEASVVLLVWSDSTARQLREIGYQGPIAFITNSLTQNIITGLSRMKDVWVDASTQSITKALVTKAHEEHIPVIGFAYTTKNAVIDDLDKGIDAPATNGIFALDDLKVWQGGSY